MSKEDHKFIRKYFLTVDQYIALTEEFNIGAGVELAANKLIFHGSPTRVHEHVAMKFDDAIVRTYGDDDLVPYGAGSKVIALARFESMNRMMSSASLCDTLQGTIESQVLTETYVKEHIF